MRLSCLLLCCGVLLLGGASSSLHGQAPNDDCGAPQFISDNTSFIVDTSTAGPPAGTPDPDTPVGSPSCHWNGDPSAPHNSLWYRVVPTANTLQIDTCSTTGLANTTFADSIITLYSGNCGQLVEVECSEDVCDLGGLWLSRVCANVTPGENYLVYIANTGGYAGSVAGEVEVVVSSPCPMPPINDDCANATVIALNTPEPYSNQLSTVDGLTGVGACAQGTADIWYQFTPTTTESHTIQTCVGVNYDSVVLVYTDNGVCPPAATDLVACDRDSCAGVNGSLVDVTLNAGQPYLIRVGGWNAAEGMGTLEVRLTEEPVSNLVCQPGAGADDFDLFWDAPTSGTTASYNIYSDETGTQQLLGNVPVGTLSFSGSVAMGTVAQISFCVEAVGSNGVSDQECCSLVFGAIPNDLCANATPVGDGTLSSTIAVGVNDGDSSCEPGTVNPDAWYAYTASCTGQARIDMCGTNALSGMDALLTVFDACGGMELACNDDHGGLCPGGGSALDSALDVPVTAGQTLLIRVSHFGTDLGTGEFTLNISCSSPVVDLACCGGVGPEDFDLSWSPPVSGVTTEYRIYSDESGASTQIGTVLPPATTFSGSVMAGFSGGVEFCVEAVTASGPATQVCCTLGFATVANDNCCDATPIFDGLTSISTIGATTDGSDTEPFCDPGPFLAGQLFQDVWFSYQATVTGPVEVSTCNMATFDTRLAVYSSTACPAAPQDAIACDDDAAGMGGTGATCAGFTSELAFNATVGEMYLIRVGGFDAAASGTADLRIGPFCSDPSDLTCVYDCASQTTALTWTNNDNYSSIDVLANGVIIAAGLAGTTQSFNDVMPAEGVVTYTIEATCSSNGAVGAVDCLTAVVVPSQDLILHLEGLEPEDAGFPGEVDSGSALLAALESQGREATIIRSGTFQLEPCWPDALAAAETIWVLRGTNPNDWNVLPATDGDALAAAATGRGIYIEGADHWTTQHTPSLLDDRDPVDLVATVDGSDFLSEIDGLAGTLGDLSMFMDVPYTQDQSTLNDFTDELVVKASTPTLATDLLMQNSDETGGLESDFGVLAIGVHVDGGVVISSSFEFGGFGDAAARESLVCELLALMGFPCPGGVIEFRRGDCNNDGSVNIADAIFALSILFPSGTPPIPSCEESCNANDDAAFNIADAISLLGSLFGAPPVPLPAPGSTCGVDPTPSLSCAASACP